MNEFKFPKIGITQIKSKIENLVMKNLYLEKLARDALKSFIHSYNNYSLKDVFDVRKINKIFLFKSFGIPYLNKNLL
jgi:ATP-dependent RNA helicase DDX18/HAS1